MKIQIESDFHDYYDHAFASKYDTPDYVLKRPSVYPQLPREKMFQLFTEYGMSTPQYGRDKSLFTCEYVVEHLDETAHRGDGKHLVDVDDAKDETFKVAHVVTTGSNLIVPSMSRRVLFIGNHQFDLQYIGLHDWRSNGPDCNIHFRGIVENGRDYFDIASKELAKFPIVALDYVKNGEKKPLYLDINISPSWKGTFLEKLLHPSVVHEFIEEYVREIQAQ